MVTTSVGVSNCPEHSDDLDMLIKHADTAMYQAKRKGGNNYQLFDPSDAN